MLRKTALLVAALAATLSAQPSARRVTNLPALQTYPTFYHLRPVVIIGTLTVEPNGTLRLRDESSSIRVIFKDGLPEGLSEVRGEFWDMGRMNHDDPRFSSYDMKGTFQIDPEGAWPRPGEVTAIVASAITPATFPPAATVRSMALFPTRYVDQKVTITGQFSGRNLLGDLPDAPGNSRYDFVLRSADAAVWVSNLRPRGRDFELALDTRLDTGRWVQVSGVVKQGRGLVWVDGTAGTVALTKPPAETLADAPIRVPAAPPPEVVFSAPIADETDVSLTTNIRIQFSRDINPATLKGRVRVQYIPGAEPGAPVGAITDFTTQYVAATRVLEIRFLKPLDRFRTVQVQLGEEILGRDEQPLKPWTLSFTTGS
jgi:Bacterial Ig-like domain